MKLKLVAVLVSLAFCSGCSTVVSHALSKGPPPVYAGTWLDTHVIKDAGSEAASDGAAALVFTYGIIDCPFSIVGDTICLPYDLTMQHELTGEGAKAAPKAGVSTAVAGSGHRHGELRGSVKAAQSP